MSNSLAESFKAKFPSLYIIIKLEKKDKYSQLALNLQNVESDLVIRVVCKKMLEKYPALEILTIHDSISVPLEYVEETKKEIAAAFKKYGIKPTLKVDSYEPIKEEKVSVIAPIEAVAIEEELSEDVKFFKKWNPNITHEQLRFYNL